MRRSAPWLTALLQTVILLAVVGFATPWRGAAQRSLPTPRRSGDITLNGHQPRPLYNGSVVAGGVYSVDELRAAIARDPIVAAHYRALSLTGVRAITLTKPRAVYVSYRVGDRTYWTRDRVWLRAGETMLTDGTTTIRARCGNCVSDVKQGRLAALDPAHGELDEFVVPPTPEVGVDASAAEADAILGDLLDVPLAPELLATFDSTEAPAIAGPLEEVFDERVSPFFGVPPIFGGSAGSVANPGGGGFVPSGGSGPGGGSTTGGTTTGGTTTGGTTTSGSTTTTGVSESAGAPAAPEPGTLWLVAAGLVGLASRRVRKA